jgi:CRISPR-associated protein Cas2
MARRRYLIAYDIANPRRLRRICTLMEDHGRRLQYSVFICDLSRAELAELETLVTAVIDRTTDSIIRIDLGDTATPAQIVITGRQRWMPHSGPQIV